MARMRGPRFKQCRQLGLNVTGHPKAMARADNGQSRAAKKLSAYGQQLLEKQRLRGYYEVMEKQFRTYVSKAMKDDETTGQALVRRLETRLDNLVYRLNFASSIRQARQMVVHGHILVNGKKVDIPSFAVSTDHTISLREKSQTNKVFVDNFQDGHMSLAYLSKNVSDFSGKLDRYPQRQEIPIEINDHLIVEYYSKIL